LPDAPAWLTGSAEDDDDDEAGSFSSKASVLGPAPAVSRFQPAWSQPGAAAAATATTTAASQPPPWRRGYLREGSREHRASPNADGSSGCSGACVGACCRNTFCSFRTMLVPCLGAAVAASLYAFVARLVLHCTWEIGWTEFASLLQVLAGGTLVFGVIAGKPWLCAGWLGSLAFAACSAVFALCEGLERDDCDRATTADEPEGVDGVPVPWWTLPAADACGCALWLLCGGLLWRGLREAKPQDPAARERKAPLLRNPQ
jgi:hypothetical protein